MPIRKPRWPPALPALRAHRWSLNAHLSWVVVLALLPNLVILHLSNQKLRREAQSRAQAEVRWMVNDLASRQDQLEAASRQMLTTLSFLPELRRKDGEALSRILRELRSEDPRFTNLVALDADGWVFASAVPFQPTLLSDRRFFREAVRTRRFSSGEYTVSRITGSRAFHFSLPVMDGRGDLVAVLAAAYDLSSYRRLFQLSDMPKGAYLTLLDHRGTVLHHLAAPGATGGPQPGAAFAPAQMAPFSGAQDEGTYEGRGFDGAPVIYAFHKVRTLDELRPYAYIQVGIPEATVLGESRRLYQHYSMALLATAVLALVLAWSVGHRFIAAPIRRLVKAARRIAKGNLDLRPSLSSASREVTELAEELGEMSASLAAREAEQQRTQETLRHAQKLESLGVLAGGIAHDFNNLLTAILGNLNLAQHKLGADAPALGPIGNAEKAVMKASELTRQMLAYSGRGQFQVKPRDLNGVVQEMAHLLQVSISKKARLVLELRETLPTIQADGAQLQQVVLNLVTNASDAIGDRPGTIRLRTDLQRLDAADLDRLTPPQHLDPGDYVLLEVSDTGCGMGADLMQRIFDPFFTTKPKGHGLGLSAMLGILRGHHAGLHIESVEGRGSVFRVYFPASPDEASRAPLEDPPAPATYQGTVLVVDDEAMVRDFACEALRALGFSVVPARDGLEALNLFGARPQGFCLALLDLTMPRMDGLEACAALWRRRPGLPVILSSGYSEQGRIERVLGASPAGFLPKPYRVADLRRAVARALAGSGAEAPEPALEA